MQAAARTLLASKNIHERMEAMRWLEQWGEAIEVCQFRDCDSPQFQRAPLLSLLRTAVSDQNVAIGDLAFEWLEKLGFRQKENAGWCEEILPEIRTVKRYPAGAKPPRSGVLDGNEVCVKADQ